MSWTADHGEIRLAMMTGVDPAESFNDQRRVAQVEHTRTGNVTRGTYHETQHVGASGRSLEPAVDRLTAAGTLGYVRTDVAAEGSAFGPAPKRKAVGCGEYIRVGGSATKWCRRGQQ